MKKKIIVILGQTATGKSDLAVKIALGLSHGRGKKILGEIISADSRQVYKNLDIGTGKITKKEMRGVPHYLLDVVSPKKKFTVVEYKQLAEEKILDILSRGKVPIICGGTGFYIDAVVKGVIFPEVPPDDKLRKKLSLLNSRELLITLTKLDKNRARTIDKNNKVRLIRAIEIARALGKVPSLVSKKPKYDFIQIGLTLPNENLKINITKRVKKMFTDGLLKEIKLLKKSGISNKKLKELGFEYYNPTEESVITGSIKYAKRQMTWFKRDKKIKWFSSSQKKEIARYLKTKL